jgi:HK97 family phage prohead protease
VTNKGKIDATTTKWKRIALWCWGLIVLVLTTVAVAIATRGAFTPSRTRWVVEGCAGSDRHSLAGIVFDRRALEDAACNARGYETVLLEHDVERPLGRLLDLRCEGGRLRVKIEVDKSRRAEWALIDSGVLSGLSIRVHPIKTEPEVCALWPDVGVRVTKMIIMEVSVCAVPANPDGRVARAYEEVVR